MVSDKSKIFYNIFLQMTTGFYGMSYAPIKVSTLVRSQNAAVASGFKDDIDTYNFNSGLKYYFLERGVNICDFAAQMMTAV
jgi:hypothetical protein